MATIRINDKQILQYGTISFHPNGDLKEISHWNIDGSKASWLDRLFRRAAVTIDMKGTRTVKGMAVSR